MIRRNNQAFSPARPRLEGKFIANCAFWEGCAAKQVWIGLDFDVLPKTVRCIRINQPVHDGFDEGATGPDG